MSVRSELELAESVSAESLDDAFELHELEEHEFILDPDGDESDRPAQHMRAVPPPPPPPRRSELRRQPPASLPTAMRSSRSPSGVFPIADVEQALAAVHGPNGVTAADAEISRLKAQLRARDAYVVEIERTLDEWTGQLSAAGIHNSEDLVHLLGRARGHAFRVAELEGELAQLKAEHAELIAASASVLDEVTTVEVQEPRERRARQEAKESKERSDRTDQEPDNSPLRRVRGIGRRYAKQLEALGVVNVKQIAGWTNADINRVAGQLRIQPSRIKREGWIEQARALSSG